MRIHHLTSVPVHGAANAMPCKNRVDKRHRAAGGVDWPGRRHLFFQHLSSVKPWMKAISGCMPAAAQSAGRHAAKAGESVLKEHTDAGRTGA
jgi:hypothetical protein